MDEFNYTPGRSIEEGSMRVCMICHDQITNDELKKSMASWVPAGASLRFSVHNACLEEVSSAIEEQRQQEQEAWSAIQLTREIADTMRSAVHNEPIRKHH